MYNSKAISFRVLSVIALVITSITVAGLTWWLWSTPRQTETTVKILANVPQNSNTVQETVSEIIYPLPIRVNPINKRTSDSSEGKHGNKGGDDNGGNHSDGKDDDGSDDDGNGGEGPSGSEPHRDDSFEPPAGPQAPRNPISNDSPSSDTFEEISTAEDGAPVDTVRRVDTDEENRGDKNDDDVNGGKGQGGSEIHTDYSFEPPVGPEASNNPIRSSENPPTGGIDNFEEEDITVEYGVPVDTVRRVETDEENRGDIKDDDGSNNDVNGGEGHGQGSSSGLSSSASPIVQEIGAEEDECQAEEEEGQAEEVGDVSVDPLPSFGPSSTHSTGASSSASINEDEGGLGFEGPIMDELVNGDVEFSNAPSQQDLVEFEQRLAEANLDREALNRQVEEAEREREAQNARLVESRKEADILRAELRQLKKQKILARLQKMGHEAQLASISEAIREAESREAELKQQAQEVSGRVQDLEEQVSEGNTANVRLGESLREVQGQRTELTRTHAENVSAFNSEKAAIQAAIARQQEQRDALQQEFDNLTGQISQLQREQETRIRLGSERRQALNADIEGNRLVLEDLKQRLATLIEEIPGKRAELQAKQRELNGLNKSIGKKAEASENAAVRLQVIGTTLGRMQEELEMAEKARKNLSRLIEEQMEAMRMAEAERDQRLGELTAAAEAKNRDISTLAVEFETAKRKFVALTLENEAIMSELEKLGTEKATKQVELNRLREELTRLEEAKTVNSQAAEALATQLRAQATEVGNLRTTLQAESERKQQLQSETETLQTGNQEAAEANARRRGQLAAVEASERALRRQIASINERIIAQQAELDGRSTLADNLGHESAAVEAQVQVLTAQIENLTSQKDSQMAKLEALGTDLVAARSNSSDLAEQVERFRMQNEELTQQISDADKTHGALGARLVTLLADNERMESEKTEKESESAALQLQIEGLQEGIGSRNAEIGRLVGVGNAQRKELSRLKGLISKNSSELADLNRQLALSNAELDRLRGIQTAHSSEITVLDASIESLSHEIGQKKAENGALTGQLQNLTEQIRTIEGAIEAQPDLDDLRAKLLGLRAARAELETAQRKLESEITDFEVTLRESNARKGVLSGELAAVLDAVANAEREREATTARLIAIQLTIDETNRTIETLTTQAEGSQARVAAARAALAQSEAEIEQLQSLKFQADGNRQQVERDLQTARDRHKVAISASRYENAEMQRELGAVRRSKSQLESNLSSVTDQLKTLNARKRQANSQNLALAGELAAAQAKSSQLSRQVGEARSGNSEILRQLQALGELTTRLAQRNAEAEGQRAQLAAELHAAEASIQALQSQLGSNNGAMTALTAGLRQAEALRDQKQSALDAVNEEISRIDAAQIEAERIRTQREIEIVEAERAHAEAAEQARLEAERVRAREVEEAEIERVRTQREAQRAQEERLRAAEAERLQELQALQEAERDSRVRANERRRRLEERGRIDTANVARAEQHRSTPQLEQYNSMDTELVGLNRPRVPGLTTLSIGQQLALRSANGDFSDLVDVPHTVSSYFVNNRESFVTLMRPELDSIGESIKSKIIYIDFLRARLKDYLGKDIVCKDLLVNSGRICRELSLARAQVSKVSDRLDQFWDSADAEALEELKDQLEAWEKLMTSTDEIIQEIENFLNGKKRSPSKVRDLFSEMGISSSTESMRPPFNIKSSAPTGTSSQPSRFAAASTAASPGISGLRALPKVNFQTALGTIRILLRNLR